MYSFNLVIFLLLCSVIIVQTNGSADNCSFLRALMEKLRYRCILTAIDSDVWNPRGSIEKITTFSFGINSLVWEKFDSSKN